MTWLDLFKEGTRTLREAGIEEAENDARELLLAAGRMSLGVYAMKHMEKAEEDETQEYYALIGRRASHEPLQYILGRTWFFGYEFFVDERVLIPRYDTEVLVDAVLGWISRKEQGAPLRMLDLCTGSGCVLLTVMREAACEIDGTGTDISQGALEVASLNAERLGVEPELLQGDLLSPAEGNYDIITANPPYIPTDVIPTLSEEVRNHEPLLALDGEADGLHFYRRIAAGAPAHLKDGGLLAMEIGFDQAEAVSALLKEQGFSEIGVVKDLAGLDRVVTGIWREHAGQA